MQCNGHRHQAFLGDFRSKRMREPILVKRYAGSRFYCPGIGRYVTIEELREWHRRGIAVEVRDDDSGEDVTRAVLD